MDSSLYFKNKKFISASRAGEITGYTSDYIGQLCRAKKIKSKIVGRTRYVLESEILSYNNDSSKKSKIPEKTLIKLDNKNTLVPSTAKLIKNKKPISLKTKKVDSKNLTTKTVVTKKETKIKSTNAYSYLNPKLVDKSRVNEIDEIGGLKRESNNVYFDKTDLLPSLNKKFDYDYLRYKSISNINNKVQSSKRSYNKFDSEVGKSAILITGIFFIFSFLLNGSQVYNQSKSFSKSFIKSTEDTPLQAVDLLSSKYFQISKAVSDSKFKLRHDFDFGNDPFSFTALSLGSVGNSLESAGSWLKDIGKKILKPWNQEETTIFVEEDKKDLNEEKEKQIVSNIFVPKSQTVFIQGTDKSYVDQKIEELKQFFLTSPLAPNVNRYYVSRQNDVLASLIRNSSSSGSGGSSSSGAESISDLSDVSLSPLTYGDLFMYNGTDWINIATSSLGIVGSGSSFGKSWEINSSGFLTPTTTLPIYIGQATSTLLSANYAQFGATATSTFTTSGKLGIASSSPFARLGVETQAGDIWGFAVGSSTKSLLSVSTDGFGTTTLAGLNIAGLATSTSNVGFNITTGCYAVNGTCISTSGGSSASSTLLADSNTFSGSNNFTQKLGLASSTPFAKLSINSAAGEAAFAIGSSTGSSFLIDRLGNVLIGTTVPFGGDKKLQVYSSTESSYGVIEGRVDSTTGFNVAINGTAGGVGANTNYGLYGWASGATTNWGLYVASGDAYFNKNIGVGTTSPYYQLTVASSTGPQLALSAGAGINQWTFRNAGGNFYLSTTTVAGTATTSISALEISGSGFGTTTLRGLNIAGLATSTSNVGFNITTGCYAIAGTCLSTSGGGGTPGGTGTEIQYRSGASSFGAIGSSAFDSNGGFLGIGTTTPKYLLNLATTTRPQLALQGNNNDNPWTFRSIGNNLYISTSSPTTFATSTFTALSILSDNKVGISTSTPAYLFDVYGDGAIARFGNTSSKSIELRSDDSATGLWLRNDGTNSVISTKVGSIYYGYNGNASLTHKFIAANSSEALTIDVSGNVGINKSTSIGSALDVGGTAQLRGSAAGTGLYVNSSGLVGINTAGQAATFQVNSGSQLGSYSFSNWNSSGSKLSSVIASTNNNGGSSLSTAEPALVLVRNGVTVQSFDNIAEFKLSRYENVSTNARTRLDIALTHGAGDATGTNVMSLLSSGRVGIGTTTPANQLTIASSTGPQLALSAGAGINQWTFRNAGGNFYLSTTTVAGTATTSISALEISGSGFGTTTLRGLNIAGLATSTSNVGFNITTGCYAVNGTCISGASGLSSYDAWTHPAAGQSATTSLMLLYGQASSTQFSANQAWFGGTATSTFTSTGRLGIATTTNLNASLTLQGASGLDILRVATSSSGSNIIVISEWGGITQKVSSSTALSIQMASGTPVFEVDTTAGHTNAGIDITAATGQTSNLLNFFSSGSTFMSGFTAAGGLFMNMSSTTAINIYDGSGNAAFVVDSTNKNVSIGTSTLNYDLTVQGSQASNYIARIDNADTGTNADGLLITLGVANASRNANNYFIGFADGTQTVAGKIQGGSSAVAYTTTAADLAEYFRASDPYNKAAPGEIVVLDKNKQKTVKKAGVSNSEGLTIDGDEPFGIISTSPGFIGNGPICFVEDTNCDTEYSKYNVLVAIAGQVPVRVSNENGPINVGDYLTLSTTTPGVATKLVGSGYIVGVAVSKATTTNFIRPIDPNEASTTKQIIDSAETVTAYIKSGWRDVGSVSTIVDENGDFKVPTRWESLFAFFKQVGLEFGQNFVKITNLVVNKITADKLETKELCIEEVCIDKTQLQAIVSGAGITLPTPYNTPIISDPNASSTASTTPTENIINNEDSTSSTTPSTLEIVGSAQNNENPEPEVVEHPSLETGTNDSSGPPIETPPSESESPQISP